MITRRDVLEATAFNAVLVGMAVAAIHHASDVLVALSAVAFGWMASLVWRAY